MSDTDYSDAIDQVARASGSPGPAPADEAAPPVDTSTPVRDPVGLASVTYDKPLNTTTPMPPLPPSEELPPGAGASAGSNDGVLTDEDLARIRGHAPTDYSDAIDQVAQQDQLAEEQRQRAAKFLSWNAAHPLASPADAVDVLKYSELSGMPPDFVAAHLAHARNLLGGEAVGWDALTKNAPVLSNFLAEHHVRVPAMQADLPNLSTFGSMITHPLLTAEDVWHAVGQTAPALADALKEQRLIGNEDLQAFGDTSQETQQAVDQIEPELKGPDGHDKDYGARSYLGKSYLGLVKLAPMIGGDLASRVLGGMVQGGIEGGAEGFDEGGIGAIPGAVQGAVQGAFNVNGPGAEFASGLFNYGETVGPLRKQLLHVTDKDGNPLDPTVATYAAHAGAVITAGLMAVGGGYLGSGLEKLGAGVPGARQLLARTGPEALMEALAKGDTVSTLNRLFVRYGTHVGSMALMMAAQGAISAATQEAAKASSGQPFDVRLTNIWDAAKQGFHNGLQIGVTASMLSTGRELMGAAGEAKAARADAARVEAASAAVNNSETFQKLPEQARQYATQLKNQPAATKKAFVDLDAFDGLYQDAAPAMAAKIIGDGGQAYAQAKATGSPDLQIPIDRYSDLLRSPDGQKLKDAVRFDQGGLSARGRRAVDAADAQRIVKMKALAKLSPDQLDDSARKVYDDFYAKAVAAKAPEDVADANARQAAALFQTLAEKFQEQGSESTAWDFYKQHELAIYGPRMETLRPEEPAPASFADEGLRPEMRDAFNALTPEEQKSRFFTDYNGTGLLNFRGYAGRAPDAERPFTAELGVEGTKALNDVHGHDALDNALKKIAPVFREHGVPDAVRTGNTIKFDVRSPKHAQEIAAAAQEALGHGVRVTHGVAEAPALEPGMLDTEAGRADYADQRLKAAAEAHNAAKDALRDLPAENPNRLGHRLAPAAVFLKDEKPIDFDHVPAQAEPVLDENGQPKLDEQGKPVVVQFPEKLKPGHLRPDSDEAKAILERAAERSKPFAESLRDLPAPARAELTPAHEDSYAEHLEKHDPFDTIHIDADGALTLDGYHAAEEAAIAKAKRLAEDRYGPKYGDKWKRFIHYASADARGIKAIDKAFGHAPTDEIMSEVTKILMDHGGARFNVSRPHGDEFYAVFVGDRSELDRFFNETEEETGGEHSPAFWLRRGDEVILQRGVQIAHGLGSTFHEADHDALPEAKRQQLVRPPERIPADRFAEVARDLRREGHELARVGRPGARSAEGEARSAREGRVESGAAQAGAGVDGARGARAERAGRDLEPQPGGGAAPDAGGDGGAGPGRDEGRGRGGGDEGARPLYVAPEVKLSSQVADHIPTEGQMARAEAAVARMTNPIRHAAAQDFLDFVRDYLAGKDTTAYGNPLKDLPRDVENALASIGIVDPRYGYRGEDELRHQRRGGKGRGLGLNPTAAQQAKAAEFRERIEGHRTATKAELERAIKTREMIDNAERERLQGPEVGEGEDDDEGNGRLDQPRLQGPRNLLVQHNLKEESLLHAGELGGLAAPSLAISRAEHPLTGYGDVTLLAHPDMIDPKTGVPVYESDIYSPRHPRVLYRVNRKPALALFHELKPFEAMTRGYVADLEGEIEREGAAKAVENPSIRPVLEAAFLKERGVAVEPAMRDATLRNPLSSTPAMREFFEEHGVEPNFAYGDEYHQALTEAVKKGADQFAEQPDKPNLAQKYREELLDENGRVFSSDAAALLDDAKAVGTKEVDTNATREDLDAKVKEVGEDEFKKWALGKMKALQGEPYISRISERTGLERRIPYTLENVLKEVTRKIRQGEDFNYGLGTARAAGSKRFRSIEDIQRARDRITSKAEFEQVKKANDERFGELANELAKYHPSTNGFHVLDALAEAVGNSYKRGRSVAHELELSQFKGVPPELVGKVSDFARDLLAMPTEYFEAKPQRAVGLHEFHAAVVPHDISPEALEVLRRSGIHDIQRYERGNEKERQAAIAAAADRNHVLFQPPDAAGGEFRLESGRGRGYISFVDPSEAGKGRRFNIRLLQDADASTLSHELFHYFSEVLGDIAQRPDAPQEVRDDYAALIKWMGYDNHEQRLAEGKERFGLAKRARAGEKLTREERARLNHLTAKEERAAVGWEQYLLEGKTPSLELAGVFERMRKWLTRIYRGVLGIQENFRRSFGEEFKMTDEVRGVFDRLLASDDEIRRQHSASEAAKPFPGLFDDATPEERSKYEHVTDDVDVQARNKLRNRIARAQKGENDAEMRAERERFREQAEQELDEHPGYRALRYLQDGDTPESPGKTPETHLRDGKPIKLDRESLVKQFGKDAVLKLPRGIFAGEGEPGVSADGMANLLGWDGGGDSLIRTLAKLPKREDVIKAEVENRVAALYGPHLVDSPNALAAEAFDTLPNDAAVRKAILERRRLASKIVPRRAPHDIDLDRALFERQARRLVAQLPVADLMAGREGAAGGYRRAMETSARRARQAYEGGRFNEALGHNESQLLSLLLWREADIARDRAQSNFKYLKGATKAKWRGDLGKADLAVDDGTRAYRDTHDLILQSIGLMPKPPNAPPPKVLGDLIARAAASAHPADVDPLAFDVDELRELLYAPKPWGQLTSEQAQNVTDAIRNIRHLAMEQNKVTVEGDQIAKDELFERVEKELEGLPKVAARDLDPNVAGRPLRLRELAKLDPKALARLRVLLTHGPRILDANLSEMETMLDLLGSPTLKKAIWGNYLGGRNGEHEMVKDFLEKFVQRWENLPEDMRKSANEWVDVSDLQLAPELAQRASMANDGRVTRKWAWMAALNMGNDGNKERFLGGYGWKEGDVMRALNRILTKPEWDWIQGTWDLVGEFYPHIARTEEQESGVPPGQVQPTPVETPHGTYRGGYWPARYDPRVDSKVAQWQESREQEKVFSGSYRSASTNKGHAKARAEHYENVVNLDMNVMPSHVSQVTHDVNFRKPVKDIAKLFADPRFKKIIRDNLGDEYLKQFDPWIKSVANSQADAVPAADRDAIRVLSGLRSRIAIEALGGNIGLALTHATYPFMMGSTGEVSPKHLAIALAKTLSPLNWKEQRAWALENSPELRFRAEQTASMLRNTFDEASGQISPLQRKVVEMSFVMLEKGEQLTATPEWIARYNQALEAGLTDDEAQGLTHDEAAEKLHAKAVDAADAMIRRWYIHKTKAEAPNIIRSPYMGALLMFYGYMNKIYNVERRWARELHLSWSDDDASFASRAGAVAKFGGKNLAIGIFGQALGDWVAGRGPDKDESDWKWLLQKLLVAEFYPLPWVGQIVDGLLTGHVSVRAGPGADEAMRVAKTLQEMSKHPTKEKAIEDALRTLGVITNLPTGQVVRTGGYIYDTATGQQRPQGPVDVGKGLIYGTPYDSASH